jgi:hypothetical protein
MASWRATKEACDFCSDTKLRATVMSTMLPEEIFGGRRMEGNSICGTRDVVSWMLREGGRKMACSRQFRDSYQSLIFRQQDCDARIDLADCQRDEHRGL